MDLNASSPGSTPSPTMLDAAIRIGLVALLLYACGRIVLPFAGILAWSAILAVMLYPLHLRLAGWLGNRWSAVLIGLVGVAVALGPMVIVVTSLATSIYSLISSVQSQDLALPPPPVWLDGTPLVGEKLTEVWTLVATNLPAALTKYGQLLSGPAAWLASFAGGLATGELAFVLSFAIAAVLVAYGEGATKFGRRLLERVTGSTARAAQLVTLTAATIRGVALGVVGVALVQSLLLGIGYFAIGLKATGLLTLAALVLGIVQVPLILLTLPVVVYVFATESTHGGGYLSGLERRRRAQRQSPQAVDAGQGAGGADAGHSDRRHRRHARRWSSWPVRRTCAAGGELCPAARMAAAAPDRWRAADRRHGETRSHEGSLDDLSSSKPSAAWHDTLNTPR